MRMFLAIVACKLLRFAGKLVGDQGQPAGMPYFRRNLQSLVFFPGK